MTDYSKLSDDVKYFTVVAPTVSITAGFVDTVICALAATDTNNIPIAIGSAKSNFFIVCFSFKFQLSNPAR